MKRDEGYVEPPSKGSYLLLRAKEVPPMGETVRVKQRGSGKTGIFEVVTTAPPLLFGIKRGKYGGFSETRSYPYVRVGVLPPRSDVVTRQRPRRKASSALSTEGRFQLRLATGLPSLTVDAMAKVVLPIIQSIVSIQRAFDLALGIPDHVIRIRSITQRSPIDIKLEGAVKAVEAVRDIVVPWRRKHAKEMSRLAEAEQKADLIVKKADARERRSRGKKEVAEADRLRAEASKLNEEARAQRIKNDRAELALHKQKIDVALEMLDRIAPNVPEEARYSAAVKLLPPVDTLSRALGDVTWQLPSASKEKE